MCVDTIKDAVVKVYVNTDTKLAKMQYAGTTACYAI